MPTSRRPPYVPRLEAISWGLGTKRCRSCRTCSDSCSFGREAVKRSALLPIVLFSHGWQGTRTEYTSIAEDLASHGFAVFGIDHQTWGGSLFRTVKLPSRRRTSLRTRRKSGTTTGRTVKFVIDQIVKLNVGDTDDTFTGKLEVSRIGAIGHSSGFVAAATACMTDRRMQLARMLTLGVFSERSSRAETAPALAAPEEGRPLPDEFLKDRREPSYELLLEDANHSSVEDWDYIEAESSEQRESAANRLRILRKYIGAFFSEYLQGQKSALLKRIPQTRTSPSKPIWHSRMTSSHLRQSVRPLPD